MKKETYDEELTGLSEQGPAPEPGDDASIHAYALDDIKGETETPPSEHRSFAAILEGLRTVEDSFYFVVEQGAQSGARILVQGAEMLIGWDDTGQRMTSDPSSMSYSHVLIRKDWTGVLVEPQEKRALLLNGHLLTSARRLRDGDQLSLLDPDEESDAAQAVLTFHEPASLVVLDSLLPATLPPPVHREVQAAQPGLAEQRGSEVPVARSDRVFFGYFSLVELLMMAAGTLALSAVIFFILDNI